MKTWRDIQKQNFTSIEKLCSFLELDETKRELVLKSTPFSLNLPLRLAEKIQKNSITDPLFRQFVPLAEENLTSSSFTSDPVLDTTFRKSPKLLQKYSSRALLLLTSACAMNCRFCFRREFDYSKEVQSFDAELDVIRQDRSLKEIILSGGDPLSLSNKTLQSLLKALDECSHLKRLRIHTRFPLGIPERMDEEFLALLNNSRLQPWLIVHTNHIKEWDESIFQAVKKVQKLCIPVLSQTVLLKGVNDTKEALQELFEGLSDRGIVPYYLHQLDQVTGATHFEVPIETGKKLMKELEEQLSGYALPKYVQEVPGEKHKIQIL